MVKNVLAGERSATGMDSERGVYVAEVSSGSPFSSLVKPNDVLLQIYGKPLADLRSLFELKSVLRFNKTISLLLFRDQCLQNLVWQPKQ